MGFAVRVNTKATQADVVSGWKDIATYLGKAVRTVQRYEMEAGLPIRRPSRRNLGSVLATKQELDAWVKASPLRHTFELSRTRSEGSREAFVDLKKNVAETRRLREEMHGLRDELSRSVEILQAHIGILQADAQQRTQQKRKTVVLPFLKERTSCGA